MCPLNVFGNESSTLVNQPLDAIFWPKVCNNKTIWWPTMLKLSTLQKNKWEIDRFLEVSLLHP